MIISRTKRRVLRCEVEDDDGHLVSRRNNAVSVYIYISETVGEDNRGALRETVCLSYSDMAKIIQLVQRKTGRTFKSINCVVADKPTPEAAK